MAWAFGLTCRKAAGRERTINVKETTLLSLKPHLIPTQTPFSCRHVESHSPCRLSLESFCFSCAQSYDTDSLVLPATYSLQGLLRLLPCRSRLWLYTALTRPKFRPRYNDHEPNFFLFRFGLPFVLKRTCRTITTEAHGNY